MKKLLCWQLLGQVLLHALSVRQFCVVLRTTTTLVRCDAFWMQWPSCCPTPNWKEPSKSSRDVFLHSACPGLSGLRHPGMKKRSFARTPLATNLSTKFLPGDAIPDTLLLSQVNDIGMTLDLKLQRRLCSHWALLCGDGRNLD